MQQAFRVLVGLKRSRIVGKLVAAQAGILIDYQALHLIQLRGDAVGVVDAPLLPQRALKLPGEHEGQQQQKNQRQKNRDDEYSSKLI